MQLGKEGQQTGDEKRGELSSKCCLPGWAYHLWTDNCLLALAWQGGMSDCLGTDHLT